MQYIDEKRLQNAFSEKFGPFSLPHPLSLVSSPGLLPLRSQKPPVSARQSLCRILQTPERRFDMIDPHALTELSASFPTISVRRTFLKGAGLAGLGCLLSGTASARSAFKPGKGEPRVVVGSGVARTPCARSLAVSGAALGDLPDEWLERNGVRAREYQAYLGRMGLRSIDPAQVIAAHAKKRGSVWNSIPEKRSWRSMAYVLKVTDRIAAEMGVGDVEVISAYRAPAYNARCGGRSGSWHQANVAVDVKFPVRASRVTATARELRNLGLFRGGVGGYWNFTHIDARGQNIDW
jgi:hypothetical protein